jgi:predicted RNase H-like HicB family nuclease
MSSTDILNAGEPPTVQYRIPLILSPQPEGGFTVTSPALPELVTEGDSIDEALCNVQDAVSAVIEIIVILVARCQRAQS